MHKSLFRICWSSFTFVTAVPLEFISGFVRVRIIYHNKYHPCPYPQLSCFHPCRRCSFGVSNDPSSQFVLLPLYLRRSSSHQYLNLSAYDYVGVGASGLSLPLSSRFRHFRDKSGWARQGILWRPGIVRASNNKNILNSVKQNPSTDGQIRLPMDQFVYQWTNSSTNGPIRLPMDKSVYRWKHLSSKWHISLPIDTPLF